MIKTLKQEELTYISGGMTGYKGFNYDFFDGRARKYRRLGFNVVSPSSEILPMTENGEELEISDLHQMGKMGKISEDEIWKMFLRGDINHLLNKCKQIYMTKGWLASKGARFERYVALKMGLKCEYEKSFLYEAVFYGYFWIKTKVLKQKLNQSTV